MSDLAWISKGAPIVSIERDVYAGAVAAARAASASRPPWTAIFTKAYAMTAQEFPPLRQAYVRFPWPHLYEYPGSIANIVVERDYQGQPAIFPCLVKNPAALPIADIAAVIRRACGAPVEEIKEMRRSLNVARCPLPLRRLLWWIGFNHGRQRANHFGTFTLSVLANLQIEVGLPLLAWTSFISYGPMKADGRVRVPIWFDHRVFDGGTAARALARLEAILNGPILDELRS